MHTSMASSSEKFPCPTDFDVKDFATKLLHEGHYKKWRLLMEDFIDRRGLKGFIDGTAIDEVRNDDDVVAWERLDNLVQAWILATISNEIRLRVRSMKNAQDLWFELCYLFDPTKWRPDHEEEAGNGQGNIDLHKAVIDENWKKAMKIIEEDPVAVRTGITTLRENVLIVAVQSTTSPGRNDFVRKLLEQMTPQDVVVQVDSGGHTALHYAALLNNMKAAKMLVGKNPELPHAFNKENLIPLQSAAWCGHRDMVLYLMKVTREEIRLGDDFAPTLFGHLISGELYDVASYLLQQKPGLALKFMEPSPFDILAEKHSSFPSGTSLDWWERLIYLGVPTKSDRNNIAELIEEAGTQGGNAQNVAAANCWISVRQRLHLLIQGVAKKLGIPTRLEGNNIVERIEEAGTQGGDTQNAATTPSQVGVPTRSEAGTQGGDTQNAAPAPSDVGVPTRSEAGTQDGDTQNVTAAPSHVGVPSRSEAGTQGADTQNIAAANCCISVRQRLHLLIQGVAKKLGVPTRSESNIADVEAGRGSEREDTQNVMAAPSHEGVQTRSEAGTQGGDTQNVAAASSHVGVPTRSEAGTQQGDTQNIATTNCYISVRKRLHLLIQGVAKKHGVPMRSESNIADVEESNIADVEAGRRSGGGDTQNAATANCCISVMQTLHSMIWEIALKLVPPIKHIQEKRETQDHARQLVKQLCGEVAKSNRSEVERIYKTVLRKAVRVGIPDEIVEEIAFSYPSVLFFKNIDNVNFIKYAIMYRRERVFNLIHEVGAGWRCITGLDESSNNGLHLAARLGRKQQINLKASAAGAILHMQREMQWFQEVKKITQPGEKDRRNDDDKTPDELFSDTHQDLVKDGEHWMKNTAGACTIVSGLIVAMAFTAAITVPGGDNSTNGRPLLSKEKAFIVFGISDALALLSSITSSLMFLLILTSRYAEEDFLLTLPMRLMFGLMTLFFSILSTMIAFSAILFLVFGGNQGWILIPIGLMASIPAILFVALQFPLLIEMIQSTYYGGFFRKRRNRQHQD